MSGDEIKKKLKEEGIGLCSLAKRMGYAKEQNLYSVLSVKDVRSGVIELMAKTIGKPTSWFYADIDSEIVSEEKPQLSEDNSVSKLAERFIGLLEEKDRQINTLLNILSKS